MKEATSNSEKILKNVRSASIDQYERNLGHIDFDSPVFVMPEDTIDFVFAQKFVEASGKFIYCEDKNEFLSFLKALISDENWKEILALDPQINSMMIEAGISISKSYNELKDVKVGITYCEYLIARLGSIMISSKQLSGRRLNVYPENHIVVAFTSQIVEDVKNALEKIKEKYSKIPSFISVITGPSRTADIEKTLVMGAHGPKSLYVFLIDDMPSADND